MGSGLLEQGGKNKVQKKDFEKLNNLISLIVPVKVQVLNDEFQSLFKKLKFTIHFEIIAF